MPEMIGDREIGEPAPDLARGHRVDAAGAECRRGQVLQIVGMRPPHRGLPPLGTVVEERPAKHPRHRCRRGGCAGASAISARANHLASSAVTASSDPNERRKTEPDDRTCTIYVLPLSGRIRNPNPANSLSRARFPVRVGARTVAPDRR